jgi:hypothetical protein
VYKVLDEWKRNKTFGSDVLNGIKMEEFNVPGVAPSSSFSASSSAKVLSFVSKTACLSFPNGLSPLIQPEPVTVRSAPEQVPVSRSVNREEPSVNKAIPSTSTITDPRKKAVKEDSVSFFSRCFSCFS